jgi:hypothetical protein
MNQSFRAQLDKAYENKVEKPIESKTRETALILYGELVKNTPVDTGRAKANWNIDINTVDTSKTENTTSQHKNITKTKITDTVFVSNHLPYIERLDQGYSQQAPSGFVDQSIQVAKAKANEL